jgi:Leucine rich repeat
LQGNTTSGASPEAAIVTLLSRAAPALDLADLALPCVPPEVLWPEVRLLDLSLAHNALESLPDALAACSALQRLTLDHNRLPELPPVVLQLPRLEVLQIADNCLECLPAGLSALTDLRMLLAARNKISTMPADCLTGVCPLALVLHSVACTGRCAWVMHSP